MNIVWLIVDSLSFRATSFAPEGPDTTPQLRNLADQYGVVFTEAYAPGPLSPSSHAAMFTGELPSATGMHEAHPYYEGDYPLVAERFQDTHRTSLFSLNMWLFQGLARGFDETRDFSRQYLLFRDATDPVNHFRKHDTEPSDPSGIWEFATADGKPVRSLLNYLNYLRRDDELVPDSWGDAERYQYVSVINEEIRDTLAARANSQFIVANYMDIHPPFDASDKALSLFAPDRERAELPIGVSPERHIVNAKKSYDPEAMERLYRATVWDFDRKFAPFVRDLIDDWTFVVVTSDHGIWNRDTAFDENRLNVPLVIFGPDEPARTVDHTVSLQSIPRTLVEAAFGPDAENPFSGRSLLSVDSDETAVTEVIHHPNEVYERTGRVDVTKAKDDSREPQQDLVLVEGDSRVEYIDDEWTTVRGDECTTDRLSAIGEELLETELNSGDSDIEYDDMTEQRLADLGYM
jgi:arylsulfatase A-like enzyme